MTLVRVYEIASKTMILADNPSINDYISLPKNERYIMESTGFVDVDGTSIYEAYIVNYQGQYYAVHKIGGGFVLCDEHGNRIDPDWAYTEIVGAIFDHRVGG